MEFDIVDYMGPVVCAIIFAIVCFLISFLIINYYCITKKDDLTIFEKMGARANMRLGPHTLLQIKRGGYASTYAKQEAIEEEIRRKSTQQSINFDAEYKLVKTSENELQA